MMPQKSRLNIEHWHKLMSAFNIADNDKVYHDLIKAYSEKHRSYHTLEHISACLSHLDSAVEPEKNAPELELALWFHDAIYKPFSKTNEEDSAELAKAFLSKNNVPQDCVERIYTLIMYTKDHAVPDNLDAQLMLDIDLSILGTTRDIYQQFEKDIRKEYKRVPFFIFKKKRKAILESFLNRPRLFQTQYFFDLFEAQAKDNLIWAINQF